MKSRCYRVHNVFFFFICYSSPNSSLEYLFKPIFLLHLYRVFFSFPLSLLSSVDRVCIFRIWCSLARIFYMSKCFTSINKFLSTFFLFISFSLHVVIAFGITIINDNTTTNNNIQTTRNHMKFNINGIIVAKWIFKRRIAEENEEKGPSQTELTSVLHEQSLFGFFFVCVCSREIMDFIENKFIANGS